MLFTDLIVLWLEVLFLAMPVNMAEDVMKSERIKKRAALEQQVIKVVPAIFLVLADLRIERWLESSSLPYVMVIVLKNLAEFSAFIWYWIVHYSDDIRDWLHGNNSKSTAVRFAKRVYLLDETEHVKEE